MVSLGDKNDTVGIRVTVILIGRICRYEVEYGVMPCRFHLNKVPRQVSGHSAVRGAICKVGSKISMRGHATLL